MLLNSNTTFVKVKLREMYTLHLFFLYSNTTFVKVKLVGRNKNCCGKYIQIQHLLKLNARKINLYDFIVLLKVLINKDFSYFLPAIMRFEGI